MVTLILSGLAIPSCLLQVISNLLLHHLWYLNSLSPLRKLRWFSRIWLTWWIHTWQTPGLVECRVYLSTLPLEDLEVSVNLQGSSAFSSKPSQLTWKRGRVRKRKENKRFFGGEETYLSAHFHHRSMMTSCCLVLRAFRNCSNLDAVFEEVARSGEAFLLIERLAKNDNLLKQKHPPLLHSGQKPAVLVRHHKGVLEDQPALCHNFTLKEIRDTATVAWEQTLQIEPQSFFQTTCWRRCHGTLKITAHWHLLADAWTRASTLPQNPEGVQRSSCRCSAWERRTSPRWLSVV